MKILEEKLIKSGDYINVLLYYKLLIDDNVISSEFKLN